MAGDDTPGGTPTLKDAEQPGTTGPGIPFVAPLAPTGPPAVPGYEVVRSVGQGGMGVVWEARQLGLGRAVALKLIRPGAEGEEEVARFLAEAQALAAVEHPNVVRVHEVRRDGAAPLMAMEYVAGGSLADRLRQGPLPPGEAARLVEQVARGVQAAHGAGIVHRDLKPANVLLTADGQPKVSDFGLARRVEGGPGLTRTGVVMGTPSYMAPEQARGDAKRVGPAADVYGLGAVLYECLTGRPPFVGPAAVDVLVQVVGDEPVSVRALAPAAPRDLETICHKALQKDAERRYGSAGELADDLRRWLNGEPIVARPVGAAERAWKWVRRHPAVTALLAVIVAGVGLAFWAVKAEQLRTAAEQLRTAQERDRAVEAEREAKENLEQARKAVDECFGLAKDEPALQAEHLYGVRKLLLEKTLPFYQNFVSRAPDDPEIAARRAVYLLRVAEITGVIGSQGQAVKSFEQARDVYERFHREQPGVRDHQVSLAYVCTYLGWLYGRTAQPEAARASLDRAAALWTALRKADPKDPGYQRGLAQTYHNRSLLLQHTTESPEAPHFDRRALDIRLRLAVAHPQVATYQADLAHTWNNLGSNRYQRDPQGAVVCYENAIAIWLKLIRSAPAVNSYRSELALGYGNLAFVQGRSRQKQQAEANYRRALELHTRLAEAHPDVINYRSVLANTWNNFGILQRSMAKPRDAIKSYEAARDSSRALHKAHPEVTRFAFDLSQACINLGNIVANDLGDAKGALVHYDEAIRHLRPLRQRQPKDPWFQGRLVSAYRARSRALSDLGRYRDAAADLEVAWQNSANPRRLTFLCQKAIALALAGDAALAEKLAGDAGLARKIDAEGLHYLAGVHAVLARAPSADASRPLPVRERDAAAKARRAIELLEAARRRGYSWKQDLLRNKAFDSLRGRADCERWVAGLKK